MANRRTFSTQIVESDAFLSMSTSAQNLYFHLGMRGDDDGFVSNPNMILRMTGANPDDLKLLVIKKFVITFESGILVIKHWLINNTLKNDRYKPTPYTFEKSLIFVKPNKAYTLDPSKGFPLITNEVTKKISWFQNGSKVEPQHNITEHNITKPNITKQNIFNEDKSDKAILPNCEGVGFVKELINKRIIDEDDIHIGEYQRFFDELYQDYPDKAMIGMVIGYVSSNIKNKRIDNLYGYLTIAIRDGLEKISSGYSSLEEALKEAYLNIKPEDVSHVN